MNHSFVEPPYHATRVSPVVFDMMTSMGLAAIQRYLMAPLLYVLMAKKNFLLLSLDDAEAKKVANIVGNDSCKKILDFLSEKEGTETEIAKALSIPLSTVHYNLKLLLDAKLIDADEYHYSEKGKEVFHYKLANKYIIITPKREIGLMQKLRGILPVGLIALGTAFVLEFTNRYFASRIIETPESAPLMQKAMVAEESMAMMAQDAAVAQDQASLWMMIYESIAFWFIIGVVFALVLIVLFNYRKK